MFSSITMNMQMNAGKEKLARLES
ncbi:hypothetical protein Goklo_024488 [Gossypium klotzschianum]|uniref:Uncharacterized protein n=1 Tax=Gossypium klotzschianum TaxID=34286 RepID=A0A7J8W6Z3_9ROSI|nr:hypothetical protein [Gossypium klotzschianum]